MSNKQKSSFLEKAINQLPKTLKDSIEHDQISLALVDDELAIIEVTGCYDEEKNEISCPAVRRLIERADTYVEYSPLCGSVRLIGRARGRTVELDCRGPDDSLISIYRNSVRWVEISGIVIVDRPLRFIDDIVDHLVDEMKPSLCDLQ
jgi:hypothetical protein